MYASRSCATGSPAELGERTRSTPRRHGLAGWHTLWCCSARPGHQPARLDAEGQQAAREQDSEGGRCCSAGGRGPRRRSCTVSASWPSCRALHRARLSLRSATWPLQPSRCAVRHRALHLAQRRPFRRRQASACCLPGGGPLQPQRDRASGAGAGRRVRPLTTRSAASSCAFCTAGRSCYVP
jgi:hypothetical protein